MGGLIIGTAGHVDHGKTALIEKMTGIDTDRLREEKERGLSIDLGFAPLRLPSGRLAGVVDVPGHEKFMTNMLAGVAGMDLVLLVIDLTEGIMPQTREHLEVIELLEIKKGIVVLTKADLVEEEWIELMEEEVREELQGTVFSRAPFLITSAQTGRGVLDLLELLDQLAEARETYPEAPLRLPLDRVFQLHGRGTVVTGTLISGKIAPGDEIEILPGRIRSRVRQVQVHNESVPEAGTGQRVALNIPLDRDQLQRGNVIAAPGFFEPVRELDTYVRLIDDFPHPLKDNSTVHFHLGTSRCLARVQFYGQRRRLDPGENDVARLKLDSEIVAGFQDPFIIRFYSPVRVMGGGRVLSIAPARYQRHDQKQQQLLQRLISGQPQDLVFQLIFQNGLINREELKVKARLSSRELQDALEKAGEEIMELEWDCLITRERLQEYTEKFQEEINSYHHNYPLRPGMPRSQAVDRIKVITGREEGEPLLTYWAGEGLIKLERQRVARADFIPQPGEREQKLIRHFLQQLEEGGLTPPLAWELGSEASEILEYLAYMGQVVRVNEELYLLREKFREAEAKLRKHLQEEGEITVAGFRDLTGSSRKYALPLLEKFDDLKITRRRGDQRIPGPQF